MVRNLTKAPATEYRTACLAKIADTVTSHKLYSATPHLGKVSEADFTAMV